MPKRTLFEAIDAHPDAQALILTSCTYDGLRYDLAPVIEAAHAKGIKVIVDEAWYGFARFHPVFRPTALEAGADYATQSTHKVLSAFSQASMIHINDPGFKEHLFRENFNMHTSTSPQYGLIASLDAARKQAVMEATSCCRARSSSRPSCARRSTRPACFAAWSSMTCCRRKRRTTASGSTPPR
ncbi:MAG: hypothetical protein ACRD3R_00020 [Terriglobales bacterium]